MVGWQDAAGAVGVRSASGGDDLPAVTVVGSGTALSVDDVTDDASRRGFAPQLVAELWEVRSGPDGP
jgi:hypothetical protein